MPEYLKFREPCDADDCDHTVTTWFPKNVSPVRVRCAECRRINRIESSPVESAVVAGKGTGT